MKGEGNSEGRAGETLWIYKALLPIERENRPKRKRYPRKRTEF